MILQVVRTALLKFRRDRAAVLLTFLLPIIFFSIFAGIFAGGMSGKKTTPRIPIAIADLDGSPTSRAFVAALGKEDALRMVPGTYDAATAEAAVRAGDVSIALIIPKGFGAGPISFTDAGQPPLQLLSDSGDPIAPHMMTGLIQKAVSTGMPAAMAEAGLEEMKKWVGVTAEQQKQFDGLLGEIASTPPTDSPGGGGLVPVEVRDVLGETKKNPVVAFYAAGVGVMFLLFSAAGAGGTMLEESESGTLDRVLSTRVTMSTLMIGNLLFIMLMGVTQLLIMYSWGALIFGVELLENLGGFFIIATVTALAVAAFGLLLAALCRTRAQLNAASTITILVISAIGGSMFPRFLMPESVQKFSLIAFNSWALEGFLKVFWRDAEVWQLWPEVLVLTLTAALFFTIARFAARRWEYS